MTRAFKKKSACCSSMSQYTRWGCIFFMGLSCCLHVSKEMKRFHGSFPGDTKQRFYRDYSHKNKRTKTVKSRVSDG